jgi:hypothetical protein
MQARSAAPFGLLALPIIGLGLATAVACSTREESASSPVAGRFLSGTERATAPTLLSQDSPTLTRFRRTVPAQAETRISVETFPDAICLVRTAEKPETPEHTSRLFADADGLLQFFARPAPAASVTTLRLDCSAPGGAAGAYAIDVEAQEGATPPDQPRDRAVSTLAPLEGDLRALPSREIAKRGFPPRPDPENAPERYERWRGIVSRPWSMVSSRGVSHPDRLDSGSWSYLTGVNWSGALATTGQVTRVEGDWSVPRITYPSEAAPGARAPSLEYVAYSSLWVGLDGYLKNPDGSRDLIQCGTHQDVDGDVVNYYAWVEYLSQPRGGRQHGPEQYVFTVDAHDQILANAWVCDSVGNEDAGGGFGCFFIADSTVDRAYAGSRPIAAGATFSGNSAEWIMERPLEGAAPCGNDLCGSGPFTSMGFYALPNYGYVEMRSPWAGGPRTNGNTFGTSDEVWMVASEGGRTLSQGFVTGDGTAFQWVASY